MSVETAREYFGRADDASASVEDVVELFTEDAVLKSPREGVFRGRNGVHEFFELNAEFFARGTHHIEQFYADGGTVICEGTIEGETTAGRSYEGVGLVDVMEFEGDAIAELRVYLDYSGLLTEIPDDVPDFRV